ncbi:MAG: hypothetical protein KDC97_02495 [Confluentibacter sp.]|nr:hypothetical protein [Confluentibacter sp.]
MKHIFFFFSILFLVSLYSYSQKEQEKTRGLFYKISLASTLTINEDYQAFDDDDSSTLIEPSALFVNNTFGYMFDKRTMVGLNFEYDWHSKQGLHFFPAYLSLHHNIIVDDTSFFVRGGYGTLLGLGKSIEKGNMYKIGLGIQGTDINNAFLIGLDFSRKRFGYKTLEGLSSVSIFLEFMFF